MWATPTTLESENIQLRPLMLDDVQGLVDASQDGKLWELFFTPIPVPEKMHEYIISVLDEQEKGSTVAFVVIDKLSKNIIGMTRYLNIAPAHRRLEIGATWYRKSVQRSSINTECKLLLLNHAFEFLQTNVVEFRTDWFNLKSRAAIARLGAKQDGVLRNHTIMATDGRIRDVVVFSIIAAEWAGVKKNLQHLVEKYK